VPLFRSPHTAGGFHFVIGCWQITGLHCCCQAPNLPWAPVPPRLLMLLPGPQCLMGPCTASHCCCLHRHTLPCATFRSPHTAGGFHFVIGCCMASHCAASTATLWLHTLVLAP
ncbi:unnamed protein product, partial [Staurois parvus]